MHWSAVAQDLLREGHNEGIEEGIEIGIEQGIEQATLRHITSILDLLDDETIATRFHLPLNFIKKIRQDNSL